MTRVSFAKDSTREGRKGGIDDAAGAEQGVFNLHYFTTLRRCSLLQSAPDALRILNEYYPEWIPDEERVNK